MSYTKTNWVNDTTPLSATNMNKIEQGRYEVHQTVDSLVIESLKSSFTTAENITAGDVVEFVNSGLKKKLTTSTIGTELSVNSASAINVTAIYLSDEKVLLLYKETNTGYAVVLTVTGTTISAGTPLSFTTNIQSGGTGSLHGCLINTDKVIVVYQTTVNPTYNNGVSRILTVSGTTVSAGSEVAFDNGSYNIGATMKTAKLDTDKAIVAYTSSNGGTAYGYSCVLSVSGTTITAGTPLNHYTTSANIGSICQLATDKAIVASRQTSGGTVALHVLSVSGTTVSVGTVKTLEVINTEGALSLVQDGTDSALVSYVTTTNTYLRIIPLSISGTTITNGLYSTIRNDNGFDALSLTKVKENRYVVSYLKSNSGTTDCYNTIFDYIANQGIKIIKTIPLSQSTVSLAILISNVYIGVDKVLVAYRYNSNSYVKASIIPTQYYKNVVGIAEETKTTGQSCNVCISGEVTGLSSLTAGNIYYLQDDGTLGTTPTELKIGVATSTTKLDLKMQSLF